MAGRGLGVVQQGSPYGADIDPIRRDDAQEALQAQIED